MKLTHLTTAALLALVTTLNIHAGPSDMKDMKQSSAAVTSSDAGFYVAAYGGANFSTNYGNRRTVNSYYGFNQDISPDSIHSDVGAVGGIKGGYRFDSIPVGSGFRLQPAVEAEALYIGMDSEQSGSNIPSIPPGLLLSYHSKTSSNSAAGFVNGIVRFKADDGFFSKFVPYVGVGVGLEYITTHSQGTNSIGMNFDNANASDVDFAAQALVGIDYALTPHWTIFTEYKFIDALGTRLKNANVGNTGVDLYFKPDQLQQNLATLGVKYNL